MVEAIYLMAFETFADVVESLPAFIDEITIAVGFTPPSAT